MNPNNLRMPVVAGRFYPSSAEAIRKQLQSFIEPKSSKIDAIACMLPHAGYMYSGQVAAQTASEINIKDTVILLGPNHTGYGSAFSIMTEGKWQTPLGEVKINTTLAKLMLKNSTHLKEDSLAHAYEHSLEVELPILQYFRPDFSFVPISFMSDSLSALKETGEEIAETVTKNNLKSSVLLVASSDMTHYEPHKQAQEKDKIAIQAILDLNEELLMKNIQKYSISMCGYAPTVAMISAAKKLGAKHARLAKYQTSGDVTGDKSSVVGYAGVIVY